MQLPPFKLEEFWKIYEFSAPHLLCPSDIEGWQMSELLALSDPATKALWDNLNLGYTESPGLPALREEISKLYSSVDSDHILTFAGAEEGIYCTLRTLLSPNDHVIVVTPCYQSLKTLPTAMGAQITEIQLCPKNKWKLELEQVQQAFKSTTKMIILNYPHNPTGSLLDKEVLEGMITLARKNDAYIFCDEVYRFLEVDESKRLPSLSDAYERGISLNVMTKSFGLAGLRIGWIACRDTTCVRDISSYKLYTSICNSAPSEILALIALRAKEAVLSRNRKIMTDNLDLLDRFFERHSKSVTWVRPEAGTTALVELHLPVPVNQFAVQLVESKGVLIMPGTVFDYPGNYFRIGFGRRNMGEALERFEEFLKGT